MKIKVETLLLMMFLLAKLCYYMCYDCPIFQAYISCPYGIQNVGLGMITLGVVQSIFSVVFGKLNQYIGHIAIFTFGKCTIKRDLHMFKNVWQIYTALIQIFFFIVFSICRNKVAI
jgi:hypothetical protein